jgi:2-keto-4-pentenoate hydratase/2-oxohepta-3-ene-1,7-dioic acid hydratase in catechol pathway
MTGTPKGVGAVESGDEFEGRILEKDKILVSKKWRVVN